MLKQLAISYVQGLTAQCTVTYACRLVCSEGIQCPCSLERTANVPSVDTNYFKPWKKQKWRDQAQIIKKAVIFIQTQHT